MGTLVGALLSWFVPGIADALVLDRERLMAGEFWRLFTHPWVHFSRPHLIVDFACLLGLGIVATRRGVFLDWRGVLRLLAVIGLTGVTCLVLDPRLDRLGGLSGLNVAFALWLGRVLWSRGDRLVAWVLLGGLAWKLVAEWEGWVTLVRFDEPGVEACVLSHWAAAAWGGVVCGLSSEGRVPPPGGRGGEFESSNFKPGSTAGMHLGIVPGRTYSFRRLPESCAPPGLVLQHALQPTADAVGYPLPVLRTWCPALPGPEGRKTVAHGVSRGWTWVLGAQPQRGDRTHSFRDLSPLRG